MHKFYLGKAGQGILYLLFCWTFFPALFGIISGISYLTMSTGAFDKKFNGAMDVGNSQQIVNQIHVNNSGGSQTLASQIEELNSLLEKGLITEVEFQNKKTKLLE